MSMNPPPADFGSGTAPPVRRGMGTGAKVLLTLGAVLGVLLLLCCGVGGFFFYRVGHAITKDPEAVRQVAARVRLFL